MLENFYKKLTWLTGPKFEVGEKVIVLDGKTLKIPREVKVIGWNEGGGHFFYALEGIKDELFKESTLLSWIYTNSKLFPYKKPAELKVVK